MKIKIEDSPRHDSSHFPVHPCPPVHAPVPSSDHHPVHAHTPSPAHPLHPGTACFIVFDDEDLDVLVEIFGDVDTARAVHQIMLQAPPEIKLMFYFQLRIWKELHAFDPPAGNNVSDAS